MREKVRKSVRGVGLALVIAGCSHDAAKADPPAPPPSSAPSAPPARPKASPTVAASAPAAPPPPGTSPEVAKVLERFFAGYKDGSDFAFLKTMCTPKLERFLTLHDVDAAEAQKSARSFFHGKTGVSYKPKMSALKVEPGPSGIVARLPVTMAWSYPAPKDWGTDWPLEGNEHTVPEVARQVTVDVEIGLDASNKVTRYTETHVHAPALRVVSAPRCGEGLSEPSGFSSLVDVSQDDSDKPAKGKTKKKVPVVYDLGETFVIASSPKGPTVVRHVRGPEGPGWMLDSVAFAVQAGTPETCAKAGTEQDIAICMSQTAAGRTECLVPVSDAGE